MVADGTLLFTDDFTVVPVLTGESVDDDGVDDGDDDGDSVDGAGDDEDGLLQRSPWQHSTSQLSISNIEIPLKMDCKVWQV